MTDPELLPAAKLAYEMSEAGESLLPVLGTDFDYEIQRMLHNKYGSRLGTDTDDVIRLAPEFYVAIGGTFDNFEGRKKGFDHIEQLDEVIAEISRDIDDAIREKLEAARLM